MLYTIAKLTGKFYLEIQDSPFHYIIVTISDEQRRRSMKIERINENQIRCTLSKDDLETRKIKLSELSYGSEKTRNLFHDMMQQANVQFGFEPGGTPLMIEAIPTTNSLILNITKVIEPDELDTRFSSFSASPSSSSAEVHISGADGILNLLKKIKEISEAAAQQAKKEATAAPDRSGTPDQAAKPNLIEAFRFTSLDDAIQASKSALVPNGCINSLYKYDAGVYLLIIHGDSLEAERFNRIHNILSEYSLSDHFSAAAENHLREHGCLMINKSAMQDLAKL